MLADIGFVAVGAIAMLALVLGGIMWLGTPPPMLIRNGQRRRQQI